MDSKLKPVKDFPFNGQTLHWSYDHNKVSHIKGEGANALAYGLGQVHARERGLQVLLMQAVLRGKLSTWLQENNETIETDRFLLKLGFYYQARKEANQLEGPEKEFLQYYIEGLNEGRRQCPPLEAKILKIPYHPWTIADSLALIKVMTYFGLAQTQQDFEKFIAMALGKGVSPVFFKSLFPQFEQDGIEEIIPMLQKTKFDLSPIPENIYTSQVPTLKASNNWVLSGKKTETQNVFMSADPHLEVNRLPALWFEACWSQRDNYVSGITLPGLPAFLMGRNKNVSFSFTYGYMDCVDYFVEEVKDTLAKEENGWSGISYREETLDLKKSGTQTIRIYETERGVLEVPEDCYMANGKIKDGNYLARAWTSFNQGSSEGLKSTLDLLSAKTVEEACDAVKSAYFSANWLFGDTEGNIGYQQTGRIPKRIKEGLYPQLAAKKENQWRSYDDDSYPELLKRVLNPDEGFLATANHNVQTDDEVLKVNLPMADYRYERITASLIGDKKISILECKKLQSDLFSPQADKILSLLAEEIPDTPSGRILKDWDKTYHPDSQGAFLFEEVLQTIYKNIFGPVFNPMIWNHLVKETTLVADFYGVFDRIIITPRIEDICWYPKLNNDTKLKESYTKEEILELIIKERDLLLKDSLFEALRKFPMAKCKTWGEKNQFSFDHILLAQGLPHWLPWNKGPYPLPGCRATICQGNLYRDRGRQSSYAPSYRMVTDMGSSALYTALPGGPSDRFYKKTYTSDLSNWLNFNYKTVLPH